MRLERNPLPKLKHRNHEKYASFGYYRDIHCSENQYILLYLAWSGNGKMGIIAHSVSGNIDLLPIYFLSKCCLTQVGSLPQAVILCILICKCAILGQVTPPNVHVSGRYATVSKYLVTTWI